jgi:hypothetical protein
MGTREEPQPVSEIVLYVLLVVSLIGCAFAIIEAIRDRSFGFLLMFALGANYFILGTPTLGIAPWAAGLLALIGAGGFLWCALRARRH